MMDCWIGIQAYDFMVMARDFDLKAQFGGNDQWSNIIAGVDLTRKTCGKEVYGLTVALLTTSEGIKMGKTQKGALWLDESKCSVYDFFQYWRNVADADVNKCLRMLTFLPMDEVNRLSALEGAEINKAKEILASRSPSSFTERKPASSLRRAKPTAPSRAVVPASTALRSPTRDMRSPRPTSKTANSSSKKARKNT